MCADAAETTDTTDDASLASPASGSASTAAVDLAVARLALDGTPVTAAAPGCVTRAPARLTRLSACFTVGVTAGLIADLTSVTAAVDMCRGCADADDADGTTPSAAAATAPVERDDR